jgi:predicted RNA binding protein YcfA (HicA-like mRNA interferase family)
MAKLSPIHWRQFERFLLYVGCKFSRQKGSHRVYHRSDLKRPIIIPAGKDIPIFVIKNNLRLLNISTEEYLDILDML